MTKEYSFTCGLESNPSTQMCIENKSVVGAIREFCKIHNIKSGIVYTIHTFSKFGLPPAKRLWDVQTISYHRITEIKTITIEPK